MLDNIDRLNSVDRLKKVKSSTNFDDPPEREHRENK